MGEDYQPTDEGSIRMAYAHTLGVQVVGLRAKTEDPHTMAARMTIAVGDDIHTLIMKRPDAIGLAYTIFHQFAKIGDEDAAAIAAFIQTRIPLRGGS